MPKIIDHDAQRLDILKRSFDLFARRGYGNIAMREVAAELDVSTGTLYHYFPSKQALFEQMFLVVSEWDISQLALEVQENTPLEERLEIFFRFVQENRNMLINMIFLTFDFYQLREQGADDSFLKDSVTRYLDGLISLTGLPSELALVIFSAVDGLLMQQFLASERIDLESHLALLHQMIHTYIQVNEFNK